MRPHVVHLLIALTTLHIAQAQAPTADRGKPDCALIDDLARRAYERIREARQHANEARALEQSAQFWDIAELGNHCGKIRAMGAELGRVGLSKQAGLAARNPVPSGTERSFSGGGGTAAGATSAGNDHDMRASQQSKKKGVAPSHAPQTWENLTIGGITGSGGRATVDALANSTVVAIEVIPRTGGASGESGAAGSTGSSAAGTSGSSAFGGTAEPDRVYRITLRMDDGSTKVITQDEIPVFRKGDRVNENAGVIQH